MHATLLPLAACGVYWCVRHVGATSAGIPPTRIGAAMAVVGHASCFPAFLAAWLLLTYSISGHKEHR